MNANNDELQAVVDRSNIRDVVARVARGEDRRSAELITSAFWPDAGVDFGIFAGSFDDYLAWVVPGADAIAVTQHFLGQTHVEIAADTARAETPVNAYHRIDFGTEHRDAIIGARYLDRLEKRGGEWRISHRTMLYDWSQDIGVSADWSQGMMGTPFSGDHFTGTAHGDHSETFFAK